MKRCSRIGTGSAYAPVKLPNKYRPYGYSGMRDQKKGGQYTYRNISQSQWARKNRFILEQELISYEKNGVSLFLNGRPSSPASIARACQIAEGIGYMRDYTEDEQGRIQRVNFRRIRSV